MLFFTSLPYANKQFTENEDADRGSINSNKPEDTTVFGSDIKIFRIDSKLWSALYPLPVITDLLSAMQLAERYCVSLRNDYLGMTVSEYQRLGSTFYVDSFEVNKQTCKVNKFEHLHVITDIEFDDYLAICFLLKYTRNLRIHIICMSDHLFNTYKTFLNKKPAESCRSTM